MRSLLSFICLFAFQGLSAQIQDLQVVATAGSSFQSNDIILDWTIGEPVVSTLEASSIILSQGFHQPEYTLVSVEPLLSNVGSVDVFPNPFSSEVSIKASFTEYESGNFEIYDMNGKMLWTKSFEGVNVLESFPATSLSSGSYMLILRLPNKSIADSYKLLKTQ